MEELFEQRQRNFLKELKELWISEKFCPELLKFNQDVVDHFLAEIEKKQDIIEKEKDTIILHIYSLEMDRLKFLLSSYLRTRLKKVKFHISHLD